MATAVKQTEPLEQSQHVEELVFSIRGYARPHGLIDRKPCQMITAWKPNSKNLDHVFNKVPIPVPSIDLTDQETQEAEDEHGQATYLWVGLVPVVDGKLCKEPSTTLSYASRAAVGTEYPPDHAFDIPGREEKASLLANIQYLRVVCKCTSADGADVKRRIYYGLVEPRQGLCRPYIVNMGDTYFFAEFRTEATSQKVRVKEWGQKVQEAIGGGKTTASAASKASSKPTRKFYPIGLSDQQVQVNEMIRMVSALKLTKGKGCTQLLADMKSLLERMEPDLRNADGTEFNTPIPDFLDHNGVEEVSTELAKDMVSFAKAKWEVDLQEQHVIRIGNALRKLDKAVSFRLLRAFLVLADFKMEVGGMADTDIVTSAYELARKAVGPISQSQLAMYELSSPITDLLEAVCANLQHAVYKLRQNAVETRNELLGDDVTKTASLPDIIAYANSSFDVDANELAILQVGRLVHEATVELNEPAIESLEKLEKFLKDLVQNLQK